MKACLLLATLLLVSGCHSLSNLVTSTSSPENQAPTCVFFDIPSNSNQFDAALMCNDSYWLSFWLTHSTVPWRERLALFSQLGHRPDQRLRRFLLSQPIDTPYQSRLRSQTDFELLKEHLEPAFAKLLEELAYKPSQQLLEYESAITILSRVNSRQSVSLDEQARLLQEQENKINQLLKIEADALEQNPER